MREYITPDREANQIRLRRSTFLGTFMLVEGNSDKIFYERFADEKACELLPMLSKLRAIEVLGILEKSSFQGVLAIVDADFDRLETASHDSANLLRTDTHDLETMLIKSLAFDKVIRELGSEEKITKFGQDIRKALLETGMSIGYLLWVSNCDRLNLKFEGLTFSKFVDEQTLKIDELKLIKEVKNKSNAHSLPDADLQERLNSKKSQNHDPWQVCCGHHLVEILSLSLRKTIGSNDTNDVKAERLECNLRLAYEAVYFRETQLYSYIRIWENNNQPFKVLRIDTY